MKNKTRGWTHESTHNESKEWYTPPKIFDALGLHFDLDPCSPGKDIVPWIPVTKHLTRADDGLGSPWDGRVWMNPPYGSDTPAWLRRFVHHGNGIALVFSRTDTRWFHQYATRADALCFVKGRIQFISATGEEGIGAAGAGSLLLACGEDNTLALERSGLGLTIRLKIQPNI